LFTERECDVMAVVLKGTDEDDDGNQQQQPQLTMLVKTHGHDERIDGFWEHYRPYELTVLGDHYSFNMPNSVRCDTLAFLMLFG